MSERRKVPGYGDEVFVPSCHDDGHWVNGIVNANRDGALVVAATGHRYSNLVQVAVADYLSGWCWPEDVGASPSGARPSALEDVEG